MKTLKTSLISAWMLMGGVCLFTACEDDRDSNPTIQQPESFVLNEPAYVNNIIDLQTSSTLRLSCAEQPDYGYTAVVTYQPQVSLTGEFTISTDEAEAAEEAGDATLTADYSIVPETFTTVTMEMTAEALARQLVRLGKWTTETVPATQNIYLRMQATVGGEYACYSNTVQFTVVPYYIELTDAPVEMWYFIGACIGDGGWTNDPSAVGTSVYPMSIVDGFSYDKTTGQGELSYTGYFTPDGFKLVHTLASNWPDQWGQGASFGTFVKNDGGSGNIAVPTAGYYTVNLDTRNDELSVEAADITPTVYASMNITGTFDNWGKTTAMNAVNTTAVMAGHNHVWSYLLETDVDAEVKFYTQTEDGTESWWGGSTFPYGNDGSKSGGNIAVPAGKWMVTFNDITGSYAFTAME